MNEDRYLKMMEQRCGEECCECSITENQDERIEELEQEVEFLKNLLRVIGELTTKEPDIK